MDTSVSSQQILFTMPWAAIKQEISEIVNSALKMHHQEQQSEQLLSIAETCKLFVPAISKTTLAKWTKDGRLKQYRIGGRAYYKRGETLLALQTLKRYKRLIDQQTSLK